MKAANTNQALPPPRANPARPEATLSQQQLVLRRFARHRVAVLCACFLPALYFISLLAPFFAPFPSTWRDTRFSFAPPMPPRWSMADGFHALAVSPHIDRVTLRRDYVVERDVRLPLGFFVRGEPALSFLGLGLRPPVTSWGVMLQDCLNIEVVANYPWLLMPAIAITATVLAFNLLGDGLRDATDPYG